jgi:uncharacterized protein
MKHVIIYAFLIMAIASGCASPQTRFYHLSPVEGACIGCDEKLPARLTASIGPVSIPDRLDRSQIVTLSEGNELTVAEFDRWAGSLNDEITRAVTIDISGLLPYMIIVPYGMEKWVVPDFRIRIDILQLDTVPGISVHLLANFSVSDKNRKNLVFKPADITEHTGSTYSEMVLSQSRAFGTLSRQIAGALNEVRKQQ